MSKLVLRSTGSGTDLSSMELCKWSAALDLPKFVQDLQAMWLVIC